MDEVQFPLLLTILLLTLVLLLAVLELVLTVLDLTVNEIFNIFSFLAFFIFVWWMTRSFPSTHREMSANEKERWWRNGINMKKAATRGKTQIWYKHGTNRWHHVSSKWTVEIQNLCPWPLEVLNLCPHPVSKRGRREHLSFQTRKKGNIAHYSFQTEKVNITNCSFHGSRGQPDRRQSSI